MSAEAPIELAAHEPCLIKSSTDSKRALLTGALQIVARRGTPPNHRGHSHTVEISAKADESVASRVDLASSPHTTYMPAGLRKAGEALYASRLPMLSTIRSNGSSAKLSSCCSIGDVR